MLADVQWRERGLPIVQVQEIGGEQVTGHAEGSQRQRREAQMIVGKIGGPGAVNSIAIVQGGAVDEIVRDAAEGGLEDVHLVAWTDGNPETAINFARGLRVVIF